MADRPGEETSSAGLAGFGLAVFAIVCCAGAPLIAGGLAGGIAVGTVLGVGAGIAVAAVIVALIVALVRRRRERACAANPDPERLA